jgi:hypothetical protein
MEGQGMQRRPTPQQKQEVVGGNVGVLRLAVVLQVNQRMEAGVHLGGSLGAVKNLVEVA